MGAASAAQRLHALAPEVLAYPRLTAIAEMRIVHTIRN